MTGKADFTPEEWDLILEAPTGAAMMVITADRGGTFRETFSMAKAYAEARKNHGQSELLDEIVGAKPEVDHTRYHSTEELRDRVLVHLRDAVQLLDGKVTPEESDEYKRFVVTVSERVANAHSEGGADAVSGAERSAIAEIEQALAIAPA
jgi:ribosomal protein L1